MAVIQNDVEGVHHILSRNPAAITEKSIHGQSPFHLAADKPLVLDVLLKAEDRSLLDQRDTTGLTALEIAMLCSADKCSNGRGTDRCKTRRCDCCRCIDLFLNAKCSVRMYASAGNDDAPKLHALLGRASELARRKYVHYMRRQRTSTMESLSSRPHASTNSYKREPQAEFQTTPFGANTITRSQQTRKVWATPDAADDIGWMFLEISDPHYAALFHRNKFHPHPSCLTELRQGFLENTPHKMNYAYLHWLISKGVDLLSRSLKGPPFVEGFPNIGLFGAHFAFYFIHLSLDIERSDNLSRQTNVPWKTSMDLTAKILRENLTDGCNCHCTIEGCSPFTWMMKGDIIIRFAENSLTLNYCVDIIASHYRRCGPELTLITYKAAIRFMSFFVLGLSHTCCNAWNIARCGEEWVDRDDVDMCNEEQAPLLETLEKLVAEFEEKAGEYLKTDPDGGNEFPQFWVQYWKVRMEEELRELETIKLTDEERHSAEEVGVRWGDQEAKENPYDDQRDLEYWFFELDEICPEYSEPWPEALRRISK